MLVGRTLAGLGTWQVVVLRTPLGLSIVEEDGAVVGGLEAKGWRTGLKVARTEGRHLCSCRIQQVVSG